MADGHLNFDTKIDSKGFSDGIKDLKTIMKSLDNSIQSLSKSIQAAFSDVDTSKIVSETATAKESMGGLSDSTNNVTKSLEDIVNELSGMSQASEAIEEVAQSADNAALPLEEIMKQMQSVPIEHWNHMSDAIDDVDMSIDKVKQDLSELVPDAHKVSSAIKEIGDKSEESFTEAKQDTSAFQNMVGLLNRSLSLVPISLNTIGSKLNASFNNTKSVEKSNEKITKLVNKVDVLKDRLYSLEKQGLYFGDGNYDKTYQELAKAEAELNRYKKSLSEVKNETKQTAKSTSKHNSELKKKTRSTKNATKANQGLMSSLKMLKMSLMFSVAFGAFSAVTDGIKTGIQNLAKYSDDFNQTMSLLKSSLTQFKNSVGTAFAPIIQVAVPYLVTLINYLSKAFTTMGQFIAALTGKKTFTQATKVQEDYAASLEDTAKAAKEAENSVYSFDRLETTPKKDEKKDTGNADVKDMFVESPISQGIFDAVEKFKALMAELFKPVQDAWNTYGQGVIDAFHTALNNIKGAIEAVGKAFYNVWTNGTGYETVSNILILLTTVLDILGAIALAFTLAWNDNGAGEALIQSIFDMLNAVLVLINSIGIAFLAVWSNGTGQEMLGFILSILTNMFDTVTNLVTQFTNAWNTAGTGQQIFQNIADVINTLLSYVDKITLALAEWAGNIDFSPLLQSIQGFTASLEPLAGTLGEALYWFFTEVLMPIGSFVIEDVLPTFFNLLGAAIEFVNSVLEALEPLASWLWDNFLQPLASWTGKVVIGALQTLADLLTSISNWISNNQGLVEGFVIVVGTFVTVWKLVNAAITVWNVISALGAVVTGAFGAAVAFLTSPVTLVVAAIAALIAIVILLVKNWDKVKEAAIWAWNGIVDTFKNAGKWFMGHVIDPIVDAFNSLWNSIKKIINSILSIFEKFINGIIGGINFMVAAINSISFKVPKWVPGIGGNKVGFSLPKLSEVKLPRLATGTVVPPTSGEFAAILGDNNRETEVVSPLSTMKQAMKEVMAEGGYGGKQEVTIKFTGTMSDLVRMLKPELDKENNRIGNTLVLE